MDKKKLTQEMIDSGKSFQDLGFEWQTFLPYSECEKCALELASRMFVVDPDGVMYYNYNQEMIEGFYKFKYFSNVDTDDWDSEDGMRILYDFLRKNPSVGPDIVYCAGWNEVWNILSNLYDAMNSKHTRTSSLSYKIGKIFESILGDEDIVKKIAESREINEKMIDVLKIFNEQEEAKADVVPMKMFAKK